MPQVQVPDFDDMMKVAKRIGSHTYEKLRLESELKFREKGIVLECQNNPTFFQNGKAPSMSFVEKTYLYTGIKDELMPLRLELISHLVALEEAELEFQIMKMQVSLFQTESANNRTSLG